MTRLCIVQHQRVCVVRVSYVGVLNILDKVSRRRLDLLTVGDEFGVWQRFLCVVQP